MISPLRSGVRWDSEIKAYFFEKRSGQELPLELEGFEPKQFSWEEKIQRELNGGAFPSVPAQKSITSDPTSSQLLRRSSAPTKTGIQAFFWPMMSGWEKLSPHGQESSR